MTPLFIGGGGHSLSCLELVNSIGVYKVLKVYMTNDMIAILFSTGLSF